MDIINTSAAANTDKNNDTYNMANKPNTIAIATGQITSSTRKQLWKAQAGFRRDRSTIEQMINHELREMYTYCPYLKSDGR